MANLQDSNPRIDVVLQATGIHGWPVSHGWTNALQNQGLLNRVFTPFADFAAKEPKYDDGLFEYLKHPQADIILLLGFDWHSQPLHKTLKWQERWHQASIKKIALLQECYSAEVVQNTPKWKQRMHQAIKNVVSCVDGLICHHEPDVEFLQKQENISLPIIFLPFYIDSGYFRNKTPLEQRVNRVLFRGKAPQYFTDNTYNERRKLLGILSRCQDVDLFELQLNLSFTNPVEAVEAYVSELNSYRLLINLPSIAPTLTVRPYEVMGCGGLLLQNKVIGDKSNQLFQDWKHLVYYDPQNPENLFDKIKCLIENPDIAKNIAEQGYKLCHEKHTIEDRVQEIFAWIDSSFEVTSDTTEELGNPNWEAKANTLQRQGIEAGKSKPTIIVDGVFFQLYRTGIARVWRSLLEAWVDSSFAKHIIFIDRAGTAPKIPGIKYRQVPGYDYGKTDADREMLQQVCDEEGADLFISSYYTTPLSTPSVFMAHDMIPELMGADPNHPMWREKHYGIQHASAYIAVSENTARDLVRFFPDISLETIKVAQNGVSNKIFSLASLEKINQFRMKYGISKAYFLLVGAGSGYKNSILFFKAFAQLCSSQGFDIVCTGSGALSLLETDFRNYTSGSTVHMLQLSDKELSIAYSGAVALVYPSKYEGFGLPVLEAIACGCPVITCPNASIPEVAGEAALYVNDEDVDGLTNALCEIQKPSVRKSLIAAGLEQAKKFSWSKMAEKESSALNDATLLPLNLKDINLIIFPDWSQPEELLCLELEQVIRAIATHPDKNQITLLVERGNMVEEDAALILSSLSMNLLMQEDLDVSEGPEISLVGKLGEIQWEALLPRIQARIVLENENQEAIAQVKAENIPSCELDKYC